MCESIQALCRVMGVDSHALAAPHPQGQHGFPTKVLLPSPDRLGTLALQVMDFISALFEGSFLQQE